MKGRNIILILIAVLLVGFVLGLIFYEDNEIESIGIDCRVDDDCTYRNVDCGENCTCDIKMMNNGVAKNFDLYCNDEDWAKCNVFCERPINIRCESNKCVGDW